MSSCPRCHADHDGKSDSRGWATCRKCAFVWQLAGKAPSTPVVPKARMDYGRSDEYAPIESDSQPNTAPLTVREGAQPSGKHPVVPPLPPIGEAKPRSPRGVPQDLPADLDSQLFERMEAQAQLRRSNQETLAQPSSSALRRASAASAASAAAAGAETGTCPVCGHRFVLVGNPPNELQTCPQCSTGFNLRNGQLAEGGGDDNTTGGDPLIGRTIRGCFIDRKVGEGGMGSVYHARQISLDRSVAIKVMPAELARNRNFIQRFEREAKSLARINHPNILHIYDFGEEPSLGIYFMIIEFVDGKDLGEVLRTREVITQEEMLDILRQALLGLETAAEKGVIHRDIKPDNLMIAKDGVCKVSDFGLAKGYGAFDEVTTAGVRVGTPAFMSPEQCDGIEVDARSDVYSLGCTVYLALSGSLPFGGDSPFSIMLKHKTEPPPSLRAINPDIDPRIDTLVRRMLAKKPDDRCIKLRELVDLVEDLQLALAGGGSPRRSSASDRSRSLNESGAVKLLPNEPGEEGLRPIPDLPMAGSPPPRMAPVQAAPVQAAPIDFTLQPELPAEAPSASASQLARKGDEALQAGRASSAIKDYQEALKKRPSREMGAKLADARKQHRHDEGSSIEARGDQLAAAGKHDEAIDEWMRAAQVSSQVARREDLLRKVGELQSRKRKRALLRRSLLLLVLFIAALAGTFYGTPEVHARLAARELESISGLQAQERVTALEQFQSNQQPYDWYASLFRRTYEMPLIAEAERQRLELARQLAQQTPTVDVQGERERKLMEQFAARMADPKITWNQIAQDGTALRSMIKDSSRLADIDSAVQQAATAVREAEQGLAALDAARQAGRHATALELAANFAKQHPRIGTVPLPAPGRLQISVQGRQDAVEGLRVAVDGVVLTERIDVFCRDATRSTTIEVSAPGYLAERRTLPPGSGDAPIAIELKPGKLWQVRVSQMGPWWSLEPSGTDQVLLVGARSFVTIRLSDGTVLQSFERRAIPVPPVGFDPGWTLFRSEAPERVLVATADGIVARLNWDTSKGLSMRELVRKGAMSVTAYLERELVLQPGRRAQIQVEIGPSGAELAAWSGQDQLWRVQGLVAAAHQPLLLAVEDRICLVDDQAVRLFEEDGSDNGGYELGAPRTGRICQLAGGRVLAIPTTEGVEILRLGGQPHFLEIVQEPSLGKIGQASVANEGNDLLVADMLGGVRLYRAVDGRLGEVWKTSLPSLRKPIGQALLTGAIAVVLDDANTIHLFSRKDGSIIRRYEHPLRPVLAPLPVGRRLVILDPGGQLTAYHLPE